MPTYGPIGVTTTGSAGVATGETTITSAAFPVGSLLEAIKVDFNGSAPATTDLTITEVSGLQRVLLTLTDDNSDGIYYPTHIRHDDVGAEAGSPSLFVLEGALTIALDQCDALTDAVLVTFQTLRNKDLV